MKTYLPVLAICLLATSLFAQPAREPTDAAVNVSPALQPCPYLIQSTLPVEPECLLCHPTGVPASNGGGGGTIAGETNGFAHDGAEEVMERVISGG